MTTTGYTLRHNGQETELCCECFDALPLTEDSDMVSPIKSTMFRHGEGGGWCSGCGYDTLHYRSRSRDNRDELCYPEYRDKPSLNTVCRVIDEAVKFAFPEIVAAPGEDPNVVEHSDGIREVNLAGVDKTVTVDVELWDRDEHDGDERETVKTVLETFGFDVEVLGEHGGRWQVIGAWTADTTKPEGWT